MMRLYKHQSVGYEGTRNACMYHIYHLVASAGPAGMFGYVFQLLDATKSVSVCRHN